MVEGRRWRLRVVLGAGVLVWSLPATLQAEVSKGAGVPVLAGILVVVSDWGIAAVVVVAAVLAVCQSVDIDQWELRKVS
eukprot:4413556-Amphidinium_carterae.3